MDFVDFFLSPDGSIEEIIARHEGGIEALVKIQFPDIKGYFDPFAEDIAKDVWHLDARSRNGRLGFNIFSRGSPEVNEKEKTASLLVEIAPFMKDYLLSDWQEWMFESGDEVLKIIRALDKKIDVGEILEKTEAGKVRLPEGSSTSGDYDVNLAIQETVSPPHNYKLTREYLRRIVSGELERAEMNRFQTPAKGNLIVPAQGGALAHTRVRTENYSLIIKRNQLHGIRHSTSDFMDTSSSESLYLEFEGNRTDDAGLNSVTVNFLESDVRQVPWPHPVPERPGPEKNPGSKKSFFFNGEKASGFEVPKDKAGFRRLSGAVRSLPETPHCAYFDEFPSQEILSIIETASIEDKIKAVVFRKLPNSEMGFREKDVSRIRYLSEMGVQVVWEIEKWGERRVFYKEGFMNQETIPHFDKALRSNSIAVVFGSSSAYPDDVDMVAIRKAMSDFRNFVGGEGFVFNGGGPAIMNASSRIAQETGLKAGNIALMVPGQVSGSDDLYRADVLLPYNSDEISNRENRLFQVSGPKIAYKGGVGTASELFEAATREKIYMQRNPIIVVGEEGSFIFELSKLISIGEKEGTVPRWASETIYRTTRDNGIYDALLGHYGFQRTEKAFPPKNE